MELLSSNTCFDHFCFLFVWKRASLYKNTTFSVNCDPGYYIKSRVCHPCEINFSSEGGTATSCKPCEPYQYYEDRLCKNGNVSKIFLYNAGKIWCCLLYMQLFFHNYKTYLEKHGSYSELHNIRIFEKVFYVFIYLIRPKHLKGWNNTD